MDSVAHINGSNRSAVRKRRKNKKSDRKSVSKKLETTNKENEKIRITLDVRNGQDKVISKSSSSSFLETEDERKESLSIPPMSSESVISINASLTFSPSELKVYSGTCVTWICNEGSSPAVISSNIGLFESPILKDKEEYKYIFNSPGEYDYFNNVYPFMKGTVSVIKRDIPKNKNNKVEIIIVPEVNIENMKPSVYVPPQSNEIRINNSLNGSLKLPQASLDLSFLSKNKSPTENKIELLNCKEINNTVSHKKSKKKKQDKKVVNEICKIENKKYNNISKPSIEENTAEDVNVLTRNEMSIDCILIEPEIKNDLVQFGSFEPLHLSSDIKKNFKVGDCDNIFKKEKTILNEHVKVETDIDIVLNDKGDKDVKIEAETDIVLNCNSDKEVKVEGDRDIVLNCNRDKEVKVKGDIATVLNDKNDKDVTVEDHIKDTLLHHSIVLPPNVQIISPCLDYTPFDIEATKKFLDDRWKYLVSASTDEVLSL